MKKGYPNLYSWKKSIRIPNVFKKVMYASFFQQIKKFVNSDLLDVKNVCWILPSLSISVTKIVLALDPD